MRDVPPIADVSAPPAAVVSALQLTPFYEKYVDAGGIAVLASAKVSDFALREAAYLTLHLLSGRDDLTKALIAAKVRVAIIGRTEHTTDIPEYASLPQPLFWNRRTRGTEATPERPVLSAGEENILNYPGDPYRGESCLIHELAHGVHQIALKTVEPRFDAQLRSCYDRAIGQGKWKGFYAGGDPAEYWAEGVQSYYNANNNPGPRREIIATREALQNYDALLCALIGSEFPNRVWRYKPVVARLTDPHLKGYNPATAPKFAL